ncbi:hypothetical protein QQ045_008830 [Rhodiola kirilowii]
MKGFVRAKWGDESIVKEWSEQEDYKFDSAASLPIWVRLPNIKAHMLDPRILSRICSKLGRPICTDGVIVDGSSYSFARVCVEVFGEVELMIAALKERETAEAKEKDKREAFEDQEDIEVVEETLLKVAEQAEEDVIEEESSKKLAIMADRLRK